MSDLFCVLGSHCEKDAVNKVLGKSRFAADYKCRMLYAKVPALIYALIKILILKAEAMPGVVAVLTHKDIPVQMPSHIIKDEPVLAFDKVRCYGDALAVVVN